MARWVKCEKCGKSYKSNLVRNGICVICDDTPPINRESSEEGSQLFSSHSNLQSNTPEVQNLSSSEIPKVDVPVGASSEADTLAEINEDGTIASPKEQQAVPAESDIKSAGSEEGATQKSDSESLRAHVAEQKVGESKKLIDNVASELSGELNVALDQLRALVADKPIPAILGFLFFVVFAISALRFGGEFVEGIFSALFVLVLIGVICGFLLYVYFLPAIIASRRVIDDQFVHALLAILLGWTLIGWFGCLFWALIAESRARPPGHKVCEMCAEFIAHKARKCKHCGSLVDELADPH